MNDVIRYGRSFQKSVHFYERKNIRVMQNLLSQLSCSLCSNLFLKLSTCRFSSRRAYDGDAFRASWCSRSCCSKAATRLSRAHSTSASITPDEAGCAPTILKTGNILFIATFKLPSTVHRVYRAIARNFSSCNLDIKYIVASKGLYSCRSFIGVAIFLVYGKMDGN